MPSLPMTDVTPRVVLKVGGASVRDDALADRLADHVRDRVAAGERLLIVHGGGPEIAELHQQLGVAFRRQLGLRVTSEESMPLVTMVLAGLVNTRIVSRLVCAGVDAFGMTGVDQGAMRAEFLSRDALGRVGGPPRVALPPFEAALRAGRVPVVAPVCLAPDGRPLNVNADTVANALAVALCADALDFLTDVPGLRTPRGQARQIEPMQIEALLSEGVASGGMIPKLQAATAALDTGVRKVRIGNFDSLSADRATEIVTPALAREMQR